VTGLLAAPVNNWTSANQFPKSVALTRRGAVLGPFYWLQKREALEGFLLDHVYQGERGRTQGLEGGYLVAAVC
jgi:hypothetical protein